MERLFAWLHNFRRLVVRWERHAENFLGMVQLGMIILIRRVSVQSVADKLSFLLSQRNHSAPMNSRSATGLFQRRAGTASSSLETTHILARVSLLPV